MPTTRILCSDVAAAGLPANAPIHFVPVGGMVGTVGASVRLPETVYASAVDGVLTYTGTDRQPGDGQAGVPLEQTGAWTNGGWARYRVVVPNVNGNQPVQDFHIHVPASSTAQLADVIAAQTPSGGWATKGDRGDPPTLAISSSGSEPYGAGATVTATETAPGEYAVDVRPEQGAPGGSDAATAGWVVAGKEATEAVKRVAQSADGRRAIAIDTSSIKPASSALITPTSDGSGQAIHPDVVYFPEGWNGYKYWMGVTPYPNGVSTTEQPEILASQDGTTWVVPPGVTNPIASPPSGFWPDPDLTFDPSTGRLYYVWLGMFASYSTNGSTWAAPYQITPYLTNEVSPAVVREGVADYRMWSCQRTNSGPHKILMRTGDGLAPGSTWGAPVECSFTLPVGRGAWHIDVQKLGDLYVALLSVCDVNTSGGGGCTLHLGTSSDGVTWSFGQEPILRGSPGKWDSLDIYRACLLPASGPGAIADVWYSARNHAGVWGTGRTSLTYSDPDIKLRAPLSTMAVHTDTLVAKSTAKNLLPASASMLESNGLTGMSRAPRGWATNFLATNPTRNEWDADRAAFALDTTGSNNMHVSGISVNVGQQYTFSYYCEAAVGVSASASIHWVRSDGTNVSTTGGAIVAGTGNRRRVSVTGTAPVGAVTAKTWIVFPASNPGTRYLSRAQFETGPGATEWTPSIGQVIEANGSRPALEITGPVTSGGAPVWLRVGASGELSVPSYTALPPPSVASIAYDLTRRTLVQSDGVAWRPVGGSSLAVAVKTAAYTMTAADQLIISNGAASINLPNIASVPVGAVYRVKNIAANTPGVYTPDGAGIDGSTYKTLAQWESGTYVSTGTTWVTV